MDPLIEIAASLVTGLLGIGIGIGSMRARLYTAETRASTAIQQADTCLAKCTDLDKRMSVAETHVGYLRTAGEQMVTQKELDATTRTQTSELRRLISRTMPAVRREEDSEPPSGALPPMRGRLPSRRDP